jgi:hypothetical protein
MLEMRLESCVVVHVECLLLLFSDLNQNVSTSFSKTPEHNILSRSIQLFSSCYIRIDGRINRHMDRHGEGNGHFSTHQPSGNLRVCLDSLHPAERKLKIK